MDGRTGRIAEVKYMGGKSKLHKHIIPLFGSLQDRVYVEPFVGSGVVLANVVAKKRIGNDANPYVISLLCAVRDGWEPPSDVSYELYMQVKACPSAYPPELVAFVAIACSFGAKWFGGYARGASSNGTPRNYALEGHNNLAKLAPQLKGAIFTLGSYDDIEIDNPPNTTIYCDPPYQGTQGYGYTVDYNAFWSWAEEQARLGADVYVSEFVAPSGWEPIWEKQRAASLDRNTGGKVSTERVFKWKP